MNPKRTSELTSPAVIDKPSMDDKPYWVGFTLVKGIGAVRFQALLHHFGDAKTAWNASPFELASVGLGLKINERIIQIRKSLNLDEYMTQLEKKNIKVITRLDSNYPSRLKEISSPPPVLYVRGELTAEDAWAVGIVGTRGPSSYGRQVTEDMANVLAQNGVSVVSGLARGVDAIAHSAALKSGGRTIAVMGSGVDIIYPPEHRQLAEKIISQGAIISDYAPGTPPDSINFPPRNRIISGLSMAVVVVEAGKTSGSLITAGFAADQGRDVFAVPGPIYSPLSVGTNQLIATGAGVYLQPSDILESLDLVRNVERREFRKIVPADGTESALYNFLNTDPVHVDEIRAQLDLPIEKITAALTMMELKGMVRQVGGMNYVAVKDESGEYNL